MKAQREMLSRLDVGDDILTAGGMYGRITDVDEGTVFVEIADGVEIKITRDAIAEKVVYADDWEDEEEEEEFGEADDQDVAEK